MRGRLEGWKGMARTLVGLRKRRAFMLLVTVIGAEEGQWRLGAKITTESRHEVRYS